MAILEAAAWGLPVVLTPECNFPELAAAGAAVEVRPDAGSCETGLRQMLAFSVPERRAMGRRGRELIERNYTWPMVASQMIGVYSWLLGEGPMPGCVRSN
jgi:poly(glycerol-phosphate) alpha-glucosyltransferase